MSDTGHIVELSTAAWEHLVLAALHTDQLRSTAPRRAIIRWIASQRTLFSTEALAAALGRGAESVGRATAYRTVDWLRDNGWLSRIQTEQGNYTYARTLPGHHHHAICTRCGKTLLIKGCSVFDELAELLARQGFAVQGHILEMLGRCQRCQSASVR